MSRSITEFGKEKDLRIKEMDEHCERAEHIREEIDKVKEAVKDIPGLELDKELQDAIKEAEDAARDEAGKDGEEIMEAQTKTEEAIDELNEVISRKEEAYEITIHTIEKYKESDYIRHFESSQKQTEEGIKEMGDIKEEMKRALQEAAASVKKNISEI